MKTSSLIFICSVVTLLAGEQQTSVTVTKETAFTFFRDYKRLTTKPYRVPLTLSGACTYSGTTTIQSGSLSIQPNPPAPGTYPHATPSIHVYVNSLADETITQKRKVFPAGAVIVKEKLGDDGAVTGVGGMVKRAAGFDPKNGDWEYFYSDKASGFSIGRLQNCADCHGNVKETDYVFSVWKPFN